MAIPSFPLCRNQTALNSHGLRQPPARLSSHVSVGEARGSWQTNFVILAGSEGKPDLDGLVRYFITAVGILRALAAFCS